METSITITICNFNEIQLPAAVIVFVDLLSSVEVKLKEGSILDVAKELKVFLECLVNVILKMHVDKRNTLKDQELRDIVYRLSLLGSY